MAIPEPEPEHDGGPPLFLRPWEIIHDKVSPLRYFIRIRIVEFQDWHTPPPSSDDDFDGDSGDNSGDNIFNGCHPGFGGSSGGGRWPRTTRFGRHGDPQLVPGSGPACRPRGPRRAMRVGGVSCPVLSRYTAVPYHQYGGRWSAARATFSARPAVEAPRESMPQCSQVTWVTSLQTRGAPSTVEQFDFQHCHPCSPFPVKHHMEGPMLVEAQLCTPAAAQDLGAGTPFSIDCCPCHTRGSSRARGFVAPAL